MKRSLRLAAPLAAVMVLASCSGHAPPDDSLEQEIATMQRLLPGTYRGETPEGTIELSIRPAPAQQFLVEARDEGSRLVTRGELTMIPDAERRRLSLLYRPGVPGRGLDGRPMDEPPGLYLDRSLGALELFCSPRLGETGEDAPARSGLLHCISSLQRSWQVTFDEQGLELRRGSSAAPIGMTRQPLRSAVR